MDECTYSPQISPGNTAITAMPSALPITIVERDYITLEYPYDTRLTALTLRAPKFNDTDVLEYSRIQRKSRGEGLIIFRASHWPKARIFNLSFTSLSDELRDEIIAFTKLTLGQEIRYTDWLSQEYKVLLINPNNGITQEGIGCQYTWKVDLQEVIIP